MEEREILKILQHYRHDIINELQVVQGYLAMGKTDRANIKMNDLFRHFNEERKLMLLNVPNFALWITRFNSIYENYRLVYNIHIEDRDLNALDFVLLERCRQIIEGMSGDTLHFYEICLNVKPSTDSKGILIEMLINGNVDKIADIKNKLDFKIEMNKTEDEMVCRFTV